MKGSKEPFFVKFVKSSENSECFFKALEVSRFDHLSKLGELSN